MELGRNIDKILKCQFDGHKRDCPKDCAKCAFSIKEDAEEALSNKHADQAITLYKKVVFLRPDYADAWKGLGDAYGLRSEHKNALKAYDKALVIDPRYGDAMFGKAIALKNIGLLDEAMVVTNDILELYDNPRVKSFKGKLKYYGAKDLSEYISLSKAIDTMTDEAERIVEDNDLLDYNDEIDVEEEIYDKERFSNSVFEFCKGRYRSLGQEKVKSETILGAFYGSLCTTLLYYKDQSGFEDVVPFEYLKNHINLEELDRSAESLLGITSDDETSDEIWDLIYPFVTFCLDIIAKVTPESDIDAAVIDAAENAYVMGMLYAIRNYDYDDYNESEVDDALNKLSDSSDDKKDIHFHPSAMCYSISLTDDDIPF